MKEIGSCQATLYKVSTQNDGGLRITLDLPASESSLASKLLTLIADSDPNVFVAFVKPEGDSLGNALDALSFDD